MQITKRKRKRQSPHQDTEKERSTFWRGRNEGPKEEDVTLEEEEGEGEEGGGRREGDREGKLRQGRMSCFRRSSGRRGRRATGTRRRGVKGGQRKQRESGEGTKG